MADGAAKVLSVLNARAGAVPPGGGEPLMPGALYAAGQNGQASPPAAPPAAAPPLPAPPTRTRSQSQQTTVETRVPTHTAVPQVRVPRLSGTQAEVRDRMARATPSGEIVVDEATPEPEGYTQPDFVARPPEEAQQEAYMYSQLVAMGNRAPEWVQRGWEGIQQRKSQRLAARADHFSSLVQDRHRSDLARVVQADALNVEKERLVSQHTRAALDQIATIAMTEAELQARARQFNAGVKADLMARVITTRGAMDRAKMTAAATAASKPLTQPTIAAAGQITAATKAINTLQQFMRVVPDAVTGYGTAGDAVSYVRRQVSGGSARELNRLRAQVRLDILSTLRSARSADSEGELQALMDSIPSAGTSPDDALAWAQRAIEFMQQERKASVDIVDIARPGLGSTILRRQGVLLRDERILQNYGNRLTKMRSQQEMDALSDESQRFMGGR